MSLIRDFLADVASFDSKLVHTVIPLLFRPGFLTNEYNQGKRVRYLAPVKMYLVMSLFFFLFLARDISNTPIKINATNTKEEIAKAKKEINDNLNKEIPKGMTIRPSGVILPNTEAEYVKAQNALPPKERDSTIKHLFIVQAYKAKSDPRGLMRGVLDNVPKGMFVLLPIFALILKIIYVRSKRLYVEHLIFSLHCHAFVFLIFTLDFWMPNAFRAISTLWMMIYLFLAMKNVYGQGIIKTGIKYVILGTIYFTILTFVIVGALLLTMITMT